MKDVGDLPRLLQLHQIDDHLYEGQPEHDGDLRNVVFGGQILAQMIMSAYIDRHGGPEDAKEVRSIHAIFARAGD
jgi:acyl-CoA thioesterase